MYRYYCSNNCQIQTELAILTYTYEQLHRCMNIFSVDLWASFIKYVHCHGAEITCSRQMGRKADGQTDTHLTQTDRLKRQLVYKEVDVKTPFRV